MRRFLKLRINIDWCGWAGPKWCVYTRASRMCVGNEVAWGIVGPFGWDIRE